MIGWRRRQRTLMRELHHLVDDRDCHDRQPQGRGHRFLGAGAPVHTLQQREQQLLPRLPRLPARQAVLLRTPARVPLGRPDGRGQQMRRHCAFEMVQGQCMSIPPLSKR